MNNSIIETPEMRKNACANAETPETRKISSAPKTSKKVNRGLAMETPEMRKTILQRAKGKCAYCNNAATKVVTKPETPMIKVMDRSQLRSIDFVCVCDNCIKEVETKSKTNTGNGGTARKMIVFSENGFIEYR